MVNLASGYKARFHMYEQDSWIAKFIHSESAGSDHLALEIPFALYAEQTGARVAENRFIVRIDLSDPAAPSAGTMYITPVRDRALRLQTADIGAAMEGKAGPSKLAAPAAVERYTASVESATLSGAAGRNPLRDLFVMEGLDLYQRGAGNMMEVELRTDGFVDAQGRRTAPATLRVNYAPTLVEPHRKIAYLDHLSGHLVFHHSSKTRLLEIVPGNHGRIASKAHLAGEVVNLELGIALRDRSGPAAIGRLLISCSVAKSTCSRLMLSTGVDSLGRPASETSISTYLFGDQNLASAPIAAPLRDPQPCPGLCPSCRTDVLRAEVRYSRSLD